MTLQATQRLLENMQNPGKSRPDINFCRWSILPAKFAALDLKKILKNICRVIEFF